ncbi:hypothetical protein CBOM_05421 [Ceraceosorus bombacis]|uniref:Thioesterase/thiol ester dehydrase-isomerase n=1 Tax=Ceraceosorus bombacis TaxID=401625 RepID=A0A0P1BQB5_9BASI|nr:hypothetical protein CBOM_05421 [Ceraceosorus bombacis]
MSPPTFVELVSLRRVDGREGQYTTIHPPEPYGHISHEVAYGGCVQASCIIAAFDMLSRRSISSAKSGEAEASPLRLYSLQGVYLGPTLAGVHLRLSAEVLRSTKSFFTRDKERITFAATIDFMATPPEQPRQEEGFQRVSAVPLVQPTPRLEDAQTLEEIAEDRIKEGTLLREVWDAIYEDLFLLSRRTGETKEVPGTAHHATMHGCRTDTLEEIAEDRIKEGTLLREVWDAIYEDLFLLSKRTGETKEVPGTAHHATMHGCKTDVDNPQKDRHITKRCIADWNRARGSIVELCKSTQNSKDGNLVVISPVAASCAYFAFYLDSGLPYVPLITSGLHLADTSHATSLEVAVRFIDPEPKADEWHYKEITSIAQRNERTTSQAHSWDQNGNLTVYATQVGLIRPTPKL